ncbi:hypothetical protein [Rhizobium leguminosarum]|jgi:hypothetical protein|uniref:Uncharacterized protein n=1 Tax=Rhizobium leguminosarum TaxID=384 RepID=A0A444PG23_RHILE|nr:hypothetical protein [Rhizobium leguminosarum]QND13191.1 hypothetical protein HB775_04310 [Rhizobium leguminosarum bv. trifolii]RWY87343.1 hypothetical protein EHI44_14555 [Rhizobium leguminosarum]TAU84653.1 hypothetical protein ELI40_15990 [Rhizobium leguminosarum]TAU89805.1 hypothetical protein ELI41_15310 [Rhizobium leguminosarum]TAV49744.1 hypothetical protein ELI32_16910 [Rhizobium leguminosarum]
MTHFLTKASLAALLALCTIPATVSTAAAAGPQTSFVVEAQYHRPIRGCSPMHAVRKARDFGLRDARITRMSPRVVVVAGRERRGWDRITFANVRGCPLIRR